MKSVWIFALGAMLGGTICLAWSGRSSIVEHVGGLLGVRHERDRATALAHSKRTFDFVVDAPMAVAAPLFGADKERLWAPGWAPAFLWPAPAADHEGMVFTIDHAGRKAVWVNTRFDPAAGNIQYVYVVPDVMATVITLALTPRDGKTHVAVTYERTALTLAANAKVADLASADDRAGPEWEAQIRAILK